MSRENQGFSEQVKAKKTEALIEVLSQFLPQDIRNILVVGCGTGREAGMLARAFHTNVIGIDLGNDFIFDHHGSEPAKLLLMDARELKFPDDVFDLIFSFHVLEHIPEPLRALSEMARVLRHGGFYMIGTPNKSRLLGGFASPLPLRERLANNCRDIAMRLSGRWRNEAGAHAGFTEPELASYCTKAFGTATDISALYYRSLYKRHRDAIDRIAQTRLRRIVFPCVYCLGTKSKRTARQSVFSSDTISSQNVQNQGRASAAPLRDSGACNG